MDLNTIVTNIESTYNLTGQIQPLALSKLVEVTRGSLALKDGLPKVEHTLQSQLKELQRAKDFNTGLGRTVADERIFLTEQEAYEIITLLTKIKQLTLIAED